METGGQYPLKAFFFLFSYFDNEGRVRFAEKKA